VQKAEKDISNIFAGIVVKSAEEAKKPAGTE
jgi:hypothetical protein